LEKSPIPKLEDFSSTLSKISSAEESLAVSVICIGNGAIWSWANRIAVRAGSEC
jgi:hypothetical protein